jgi:hypothetical protein
MENKKINKLRTLVRKLIKEEFESIKAKDDKKSVHASMVLKLMDDDYSYTDALNKVLSNNKDVNKSELEKELDKYI